VRTGIKKDQQGGMKSGRIEDVTSTNHREMPGGGCVLLDDLRSAVTTIGDEKKAREPGSKR